MATRKLKLEISESLFEKLERLAQATDQSTESLAINCLVHYLPHVVEKVHELDRLLEEINPENLHEEIDFVEAVGREIW
ncbi:MAG: hypothetical protein SAL07_11905 [Oscillatoria sp. PMC 1051.18]|nr:hypothetical protein [Oscillatoria sp. PMC 1050.18]MEC5030611.1 hypothetical protein [Oscillatoria sp. PMC 1051.18]